MVAGPRLFRGDAMTSVPALFALQELDLALVERRAAVSDVDSLLGDSGPLEEAKEHHAKQRELLRAVEKHSQELEYDADEQRRKIEPVEAKLYEGKVTIPRELEDLQMDLESLQRRRSELDDRALEAMEALDEAGRAVAESEGALQRAEAAYNGDQQELGARKAVLQSEIDDLQGRRTEAAELIDDAMLSLYDQLAAAHQGRAVAKVEGGTCQGCRISLPMNVLQRSRNREEVVRCSSCERILYVT